MKNSLYLFCLLMIGMLSCVQQDDNTSRAELISAEKALNNGNIDVSKYHNPILLEGSIKVWVNKNKELVAYTETDTHIHLFVLQYMQTKFSPNENFHSISFLDHGFLLMGDSGKNLLCKVKDKEESRLAGNDLKQLSGISNFETIVGGGLAHIWVSKIETDKSSAEYKYENIKLSNSVYDAFEEGSSNMARNGCASGGEGSTSCSIPGCSVSCGGGYYACCNSGGAFTGPTCKCVSDKVIIEPES